MVDKTMKYDLSYVRPRSKESLTRFLSEKAYCPKPECIIAYDNAMVFPGPPGGVACNGKMIKSSMVHNFWCPERFCRVPTTFNTSEEEVVFLGCFEKCWGHCLTDNLKHLWLMTSPLLNEFKQLRKVYVYEDEHMGVPTNFTQMLTLLGLSDKCITRISKPTLFKRVYVPDSSFFSDVDNKHRYYTDSFSRTVESIISGVRKESEPVKRKKIYLSRAQWKCGNTDFGEWQVEKAFKDKGFEILRPETLSFRELVSAMQNCECLGATEGSCAHNSIFLPKGSKILILRKADYVNEYQPVINEVRDLDVVYIDAHESFLLASHSAPFSGPFFIWVNKYLSAFLKIKTHFPLLSFMRYIVYALLLRCKIFINKVRRWMKVRLLSIKHSGMAKGKSL